MTDTEAAIRTTAARLAGPPRWFIVATAAATLAILFMAVAETTLWTHFLVDRGEYLSLLGLGFVLAVGLWLFRQNRLLASLPLAIPWLIYPVLTQGDQLIDNLSIHWMRAVSHLILAVLFGAPVWVLLLAARSLLAPRPGRPARVPAWAFVLPGLPQIARGRDREGGVMLVLSLLLLEVWIAQRYLGSLMIATLILIGLGYLFAVSLVPAGRAPRWSGVRGQRAALVLLLAGVALSLGIYLGFKNRPGAYQGSPHYYHDPAQADAAYPMQAVAVPAAPAGAVDAATAAELREVLAGYGAALERLFDAYYVLDRNYNYAFHNELFMRHTPVLPEFRRRALETATEARRLAADTDARLEALEPALGQHAALRALAAEARSYVAFNLRRATMLEELSAGFERTRAGLQHATHLYEGEGKVLGERLMQALGKHGAVTGHPELGRLAAPLVASGERIRDAYANRIVGF